MHIDEPAAHALRRQLQRLRGACARSSWSWQQAALRASSRSSIAHLQKFIDRFKAKATKAKQAQSRVKALERMEKLAPVLTDAPTSPFEFRSRASLPNPMLAIERRRRAATARRGRPAAQAHRRGVSRSVLAGQRIGILGANGQGKSTLVKTIARDAARRSPATITEGKGLTIGYFAQQELDVLRPHDSAAGAHGAPGARRRPRRRASRSCATSSAASTSPATW